MPIGTYTFSWYTMPSNCTYVYMFSMRKVKASHLYESYFVLLKSPFYLKYRGTFFYSMLKHKLQRDNTFALIRSCDNEVYKVEKQKEDT